MHLLSTFRFLLQFVVSGVLERGIASLNVIETNPFKHLVHLSLKFLPGNDAEIKKYLASCLLSLKVCVVIRAEKCSSIVVKILMFSGGFSEQSCCIFFCNHGPLCHPILHEPQSGLSEIE